MKIFGREPAFWIGLIGTIAIGVIQTLAGQGLLDEVTSGKALDLTNAIVNLLTLMAPLIAGIVIRQGVTPLTDPRNDAGKALV